MHGPRYLLVVFLSLWVGSLLFGGFLNGFHRRPVTDLVEGHLANVEVTWNEVLWILMSGFPLNKEIHDRLENVLYPIMENGLESVAPRHVFVVGGIYQTKVDHVFHNATVLKRLQSAKLPCEPVGNFQYGPHSRIGYEWSCLSPGKFGNYSVPFSILLLECIDAGHEGYYDQRECCKLDQSLLYLSERGYLHKAKWVEYGDDDVYLNGAQWLRLLSTLDSNEPVMMNPGGSGDINTVFAWSSTIRKCDLPQSFTMALLSAELVRRMIAWIKEGRGLQLVCYRTGHSYDVVGGILPWRLGARFLGVRRFSDFHGLRSCREYLWVHGSTNSSEVRSCHEAQQHFKFNFSVLRTDKVPDYSESSDACRQLFFEPVSFP